MIVYKVSPFKVEGIMPGNYGHEQRIMFDGKCSVDAMALCAEHYGCSQFSVPHGTGIKVFSFAA